MTTSDRFTNVLFYGLILLLLYLLYRVFEPFLVPLAWAGVLTVCFYPWHARLKEQFGQNRAAGLSTLGVTVILIVPTLIVATLFVREAVVAARGIEQQMASGQLPWLNRAWDAVIHALRVNPAESASPGGADLPSLVRQGAAKLATAVAGELGTLLRNLATFVFKLVVMLFALFYLFRDAEAILRGIRRLLPLEPALRERMFRETRDLIQASVTATLIIAAVQGTLGGLAFLLIGLSAPLFWGVGMAFLSLVPVVGSALIWAPAAIYLLATGHWGRGVVLVAICAGVAGLVDNVLRPILLSGRAQLNGLLVFISVLGGVAVFGMLGIILGPIVVATAVGILDAYTERAESV